jgi:uncharacterized protein YjbI with pentapeptide repeats
MVNEEHVAQLRKGVTSWNAWRGENPDIRPDLSKVHLVQPPFLQLEDLSGSNLVRQANLRQANFSGTNLNAADLSKADLTGANLKGATLHYTVLSGANLSAVDLSEATLFQAHVNAANLSRANLSGAKVFHTNFTFTDLSEARLCRARLPNVDLSRANLSGADLGGTDLSQAKLSWANLKGANLSSASLLAATLINTDLTDADLTGCRIFGVSAWGLKLEGAKQQDLIITPENEPTVTVDNIEVAQFVYLLLHNEKIRDVIDAITSKAVLILGRFTNERKAVLDALRDELRKRNYLPILFDFDKPASQDLTATVSTLAHLARFIIADLTDPSSIPYELATVVPNTPVPVQPILLSGSSEFAMFRDLRLRHPWVLTTHRYDSQMQLIADLGEKVIAPAEGKAEELGERRSKFEAELTKPQ